MESLFSKLLKQQMEKIRKAAVDSEERMQRERLEQQANEVNVSSADLKVFRDHMQAAADYLMDGDQDGCFRVVKHLCQQYAAVLDTDLEGFQDDVNDYISMAVDECKDGMGWYMFGDEEITKQIQQWVVWHHLLLD